MLLTIVQMSQISYLYAIVSLETDCMPSKYYGGLGRLTGMRIENLCNLSLALKHSPIAQCYWGAVELEGPRGKCFYLLTGEWVLNYLHEWTLSTPAGKVWEYHAQPWCEIFHMAVFHARLACYTLLTAGIPATVHESTSFTNLSRPNNQTCLYNISSI